MQQDTSQTNPLIQSVLDKIYKNHQNSVSIQRFDDETDKHIINRYRYYMRKYGIDLTRDDIYNSLESEEERKLYIKFLIKETNDE